jgi:hypothetical protein
VLITKPENFSVPEILPEDVPIGPFFFSPSKDKFYTMVMGDGLGVNYPPVWSPLPLKPLPR